MAENLLKNLVLRGVRVACDVVAGVVRNGYLQATMQTPAADLSFPRHLSPSDPMLDTDPGTQGERANSIGAGHPAPRAGRLGCSAGVLRSRGAAISAARAILWSWPLTHGTTGTAGARLLGHRPAAKAMHGRQPAVPSPSTWHTEPRHKRRPVVGSRLRACVAPAVG